MTVPSANNRISYTGNGATTAFSFPYPVLEEADLVVIETVTATGAQTTLALTTDYTVSLAADKSSATVTAVSAPASTVTWTILRDPDATQETDFVDNDSLPAASLENGFDKLTMIAQRLRELIDRGLRQPDGDTVDLEVMPAKAERASKFLAFDGDGNPIAAEGTVGEATTPISSFMQTVLDDADAAAVRTTLGLGTAAVEAWLSTVSEAEAEAGTATTARFWTAQRVAQAIAALETVPILTQSYDSGDQTISAAGLLTLAHGLGVQPKIIQLFIKMGATTELGYSEGDEVLINPAGNDPADTVQRGVAVIPDATNIVVRFGGDAKSLAVLQKNNGVPAGITNSRWTLIVRAYA